MHGLLLSFVLYVFSMDVLPNIISGLVTCTARLLNSISSQVVASHDLWQTAATPWMAVVIVDTGHLVGSGPGCLNGCSSRSYLHDLVTAPLKGESVVGWV